MCFLCFLTCKFGKTAVKPLKSIVIEFFDIEDICAAKTRLLDDVKTLNKFDGFATHSRSSC